MQKVIAYSLWGNNPKYIIGAYRNIELAKKFFPDWKVRIYVSTETDFQLNDNSVELVHRTEKQEQEGCFWRFESCDSEDIVIIRDLDDRLSERHKFVVDEWLSSEKSIHIIKDHPNHTFPIMAGLWGSRNGILKGLGEKIIDWSDKSYYTTDQYFLSTNIYQKFTNDLFIHDDFNLKSNTQNISIERKNYEFLGDTFDENDNRLEPYWRMVEQYFINQNTK